MQENMDDLGDNGSTALDEAFESVYGNASGVEEAAFQTRDGYLEIHAATDGSWDFAIYNEKFEEVDGGQVGDASTLDIRRAAEEGCKLCGIDAGFMTAMEIDLFETLQFSLLEHC